MKESATLVTRLGMQNAYHFDPPHPMSQVGGAVIGYLCAVNIATLSFVIIDGGLLIYNVGPSAEGAAVAVITFGAIFFWVIVFVTAMLPVALTYVVARWLRIRHIFYYLVCGAVTGAMLAPIFVWFDWHDDDPPFREEWLRYAPIFATIGACAAAMFWYKTGRHISIRLRTVS
jgi:hypothetical protein